MFVCLARARENLTGHPLFRVISPHKLRVHFFFVQVFPPARCPLSFLVMYRSQAHFHIIPPTKRNNNKREPKVVCFVSSHGLAPFNNGINRWNRWFSLSLFLSVFFSLIEVSQWKWFGMAHHCIVHWLHYWWTWHALQCSWRLCSRNSDEFESDWRIQITHRVFTLFVCVCVCVANPLFPSPLFWASFFSIIFVSILTVFQHRKSKEGRRTR